jgi:hypothetical protein
MHADCAVLLHRERAHDGPAIASLDPAIASGFPAPIRVQRTAALDILYV